MWIPDPPDLPSLPSFSSLVLRPSSSPSIPSESITGFEDEGRRARTSTIMVQNGGWCRDRTHAGSGPLSVFGTGALLLCQPSDEVWSVDCGVRNLFHLPYSPRISIRNLNSRFRTPHSPLRTQNGASGRTPTCIS